MRRPSRDTMRASIGSMKRLWTPLLISVLLLSYRAHASTASATSETLLAWSEDGKTWASLSEDAQEEESLIVIKTEGVVVMTVCNREYSDDCANGPKSVAVRREDKGKRSGLQRVNLEKQKGLDQFALKRTKRTWRTGFKKAYELKSGPMGQALFQGKCAHGWTLIRKSDNEVIKKVLVKDGCLRAVGGFLSPSGKHLLIKTQGESFDDPEEGADTTEETTYELISL